mgnify:CR=1 FL=1
MMGRQLQASVRYKFYLIFLGPVRDSQGRTMIVELSSWFVIVFKSRGNGNRILLVHCWIIGLAWTMESSGLEGSCGCISAFD